MITSSDITFDFLKKRPLSNSSLKSFKRSPLHYIHYLNSYSKSTPAQVLGNLIDCLILTPDDFENKFSISPYINRRTNQGKEDYAKFNQFSKGKIIATQDQLNTALKVKDSVFKNREAMLVLNNITSTQKRVEWVDEETQLPCVAMLDGLGDEYVLELKTSIDASPSSFIKSAFDYQYHLQASIYSECTKKPVNFIVVENNEPYGVCVYKPTYDFIALGKQMFRQLLRDFKYCIELSGFDKGYEWRTQGYQTLDIPKYAKKQLIYQD